MTTTQEVLKSSTISGNILKLPAVQLDRDLYKKVARSLQLISGKWQRKVQGFEFPEPPDKLINEIIAGCNSNLKKEFQFFPTPSNLADELVQLAMLNNHDMEVLEPSAGQGAIVKAILKKEPQLIVHGFELMPLNQNYLADIFVKCTLCANLVDAS